MECKLMTYAEAVGEFGESPECVYCLASMRLARMLHGEEMDVVVQTERRKRHVVGVSPDPAVY